MTITTKAAKTTPVQIQIRQAVGTVNLAIAGEREACKVTRQSCRGKATKSDRDNSCNAAEKAIADANAALDTLAASDWRVAAGADHIAPMGTMAATVAAHLRGCVPGERAKATAAGKAIMVACKA